MQASAYHPQSQDTWEISLHTQNDDENSLTRSGERLRRKSTTFDICCVRGEIEIIRVKHVWTNLGVFSERTSEKLVKKCMKDTLNPENLTDYVEIFPSRFTKAHQIAKENLRLAQGRMKEHYVKNAVNWKF